jgi:hypothetical protein
MKIFNSVDELLTEVESDKKSTGSLVSRFPARLIFFPTMNMLKDIVKTFDQLGVGKIELSDFLPHSDGWISAEDLIEIIKGLDSRKDIIILPLSEVARFYSREDFSSLFNTISEIENNKNHRRRIYIPLIGIHERFETEFFDSFHRKDQWAPLWQVLSDNQSKITIYITDFSVKHAPNAEIINNTKDWLNLWKRDNIEKLICFSSTLMHLYPNRLPDNAFDIAEIRNTKDLFLKVYGIYLPLVFRYEDKSFWDKLFEIFTETGFRTLEEAIVKVFGVLTVNIDDIANLWTFSDTNFKKWLLKQYVSVKNEWKNTYIFQVMSSLETIDNEEFLEGIWFKIFDLKVKNSRLYSERKRLLERFYADKEISVSFENRLTGSLKEINDDKEKLNLLTGIAQCERRILLEMFLNRETDMQSISEKYKGLYYYLQDVMPDNLNEDNRWVLDYFKEYRASKLNNAISPLLNDFLDERNKNKDVFYRWYYAFEPARQILKKENIVKVIWIDALGMEWFPFIISLIENEMGLLVEKKYIARAYLPTITDCNRFENALYIRDFDRDVHSTGPYRHPDSLIRDIELIRKILKRNLSVSKTERIAIVSDHGSTALARLKENLKVHSFENAHHDGRCMWIDNDLLDDDDLVIHSIDNPDCNKTRALIALRYSSLYRKPVREVHGGATPEEVLVPVVIVTKRIVCYPDEYNIIPDKAKLSRKEPVLIISIAPTPDKTPALIDEKGRHMGFEYVEIQQKWKADLKNFKSGKHKTRIKIGDFEKDMEIEIIGGMHEKDII